MLRKLPLSLTRASELLCLLPLLPWLFTQGALWRQATAGLPLAGGISYWPIKAKGRGSSLSWQAIYRAVRRPGVRRCCYNMAEVTDEVEGSDLDADAETEVPAVVESESTPCQSEGKESEKVRLPYSCTSSSSPSIPHPRPLSCPYLAQNPSLVCTYSFKVPLPIYFHPLPQNQCLSGLTLFSY